MAEREKRRATTFRTSRGAIVNVSYPDIYIASGVTPADVTNPTEMREALKEAMEEELGTTSSSIDMIPYGLQNVLFVLWHEEKRAIIVGGQKYKKGAAPSGGIILISYDFGKTFTKVWEDDKVEAAMGGFITYAGTVIVGTLTTNARGKILWSTDLKTWLEATFPADAGFPTFWRFTEKKDDGVYVGVYGDPATMMVLKSADEGKTWTTVATKANFNDRHVHDIVYDLAENRFLIVTGDTSSLVVQASSDWMTFTTLRSGVAYLGILPFGARDVARGVLLAREATGDRFCFISINNNNLSSEIELVYAPYFPILGHEQHFWFIIRSGTTIFSSSYSQGSVVWSDDLLSWKQLYLGERINWIWARPRGTHIFLAGYKHLFILSRSFLMANSYLVNWHARVLDKANLAPGALTTLAECRHANLTGVKKCTITVECYYITGAVAGDELRVHVRTSFDALSWDTVDYTSFDLGVVAGATVRKTVAVTPDARFLKVLAENLSGVRTITSILAHVHVEG